MESRSAGLSNSLIQARAQVKKFFIKILSLKINHLKIHSFHISFLARFLVEYVQQNKLLIHHLIHV